MTPEQQAMYVFSQSVSALIEAAGMLSTNLAHYYRAEDARNLSLPHFSPGEFNKLIDKYGISHSAVLAMFQ